MPPRVLDRRLALPQDHGTWAFFVSPLAIGLAAGGTWRTTTTYLVVAALAGFLLRQPITTLVKILSRRRPRRDLSAALFWTAAYLGIALIHLAGLGLRQYGFVLVLAIPGVAVFAWYLLLVAQRDERGQKVMEIAGAGVLALGAPAAYWIGIGSQDARGWLLWILCWILSAMSIVHVYARLEQRKADQAHRARRVRTGQHALVVNGLLAAAVVMIGLTTSVPPLVPLAFLLQLAETAGIASNVRPASTPTAIGLRQLVVSTLCTLVFVLLWS